ncbi:MAG: phytanoyl-CoA dioxygenase [Candidatus Latescibacteria bacterium]|nr:phytanoyl-CoA dioxygenase [Candidatus Latescibacterota bacterium]
MSDSHLLNDAEMAAFIGRGHITVTPDLSADFHAEVFAQHEAVFDQEGNPGNNLLPRIPQVGQVFDDARVQGALRSIIGDNYYLQPHRHPHYNPAGSKGQNLHQDGGRRWSHRTRRLLAFYYPQDTPVERGPTGIVSGSHYFNTPQGVRAEAETALTSPAGTVTIVNYDLWHRGMPNLTDDNRYMVKFLFARMSEPRAPSWDNRQADWPGTPSVLEGDSPDLQKMYEHVWHWHCGHSGAAQPAANGRSLDQLLALLNTEQERDALVAAYQLAAYGTQPLAQLLDLLAVEEEMTRRHACYALSAIGAPAVDALTTTLDHDNPQARAAAAEILGDIGPAAASALPALIQAAADPEAQVRQRAVESLGTVGQNSPAPGRVLTAALKDENQRVRQEATFALCRLGASTPEAVPALAKVLDDDNRYTRGNALHALERIGTPAAKDTLIRHLLPARWCPLTSPASTH